ncbi:hypothetical protein [Pimelobacter simplex]|uniref:hypothetical protein n=1 Tax=Nocardioides simplex TaxID=2045 RepID=UPI001141A6AD|nr:hypothetical protein [Pimelobacter simplex]GEB16090.1 hypothetical protein NSI01_44050 [Pimelobacter simplex]
MSDWTDWKQNRRLEETEAQLAAERSARSRLADQMRTQQGNLQGQIDRLTRAFVALVEHEDIRAELGQYADAAACRRYAREVVSTVVATGTAALRGSAEPDDVPGYWLAPAARGIVRIAQGEPGGPELLAEATHRDPRRTTLLLTLLGALTRDPRWTGGQDLTRVLPDRPEVSHAQRQVWLAVADGRVAPDGDALVTALRTQVAATGSAGLDEVAAWLEEIAPPDSRHLAVERATAQLAALQQVLQTGGATAQAPTGDPIGDQTDNQADEPAEDPLADCVRSLVDEGSPGEAEILDRMATVRADLGFIDERTASLAPAWSGTAGDVVRLLLDDLAQPAGSPRHTLAQQVLAPTLGAIGDELAAQAAVPPPETRTVEVAGEVLTVTRDGVAGDWQARVGAALERRYPVDRRLLPGGGALLALAVVLAGLGFVAGGWFVLAAAALVGGGALVGTALLKRRALAENRTSTIAATERRIAQERVTLDRHRERSITASTRARELHRGVGTAALRS